MFIGHGWFRLEENAKLECIILDPKKYADGLNLKSCTRVVQNIFLNKMIYNFINFYRYFEKSNGKRHQLGLLLLAFSFLPALSATIYKYAYYAR